jgi:outer membrane receptor protein involved in Fe transport
MRSLALYAFALVSAFGQNTNGTIAGSVFDASTGRPIPAVKIAIDGNSGTGWQSDADGKFQIDIAPGTYIVKFSSDAYRESVVDAVEVKAGAATDVSTVLAAKGTTTTVEVKESVNAVAATASAMLSERKLSASVSDSLSKEEISGGVSNNAAGALEKVTGVSVVDNGYVYVRGLGERYSSTMLNSAVIPTTEPEKRVVPLDLFPAELIDNIKVIKTYTPDLPGEFSGGLVQMSTIEFPTTKLLRVSTSFGFNSRTTFDRFNGFDRTQGIPSAVPQDDRLIAGRFSPQQLQGFGQAFANEWEPVPISSARPSQTYSVVGGNTFGRIGVVGALTFNSKPQFQSEQQRYFRQGGQGPIEFTRYDDFRSYNDASRFGGVLNLAFRVNTNHKLIWRNTVTRDSDKEAREFQGYDGGNDGVLNSQRLRYTERQLFSTGLGGDHVFERLGNTIFKWQYTYSASNRDEPDLREVIRGQLPDGRLTFSAQSSSGLRFFNYLTDRIHEPQADVSRPFFKGNISGIWKFGFRATVRDRDFQARRFRFIPIRSSTLNFLAPSNQLFSPANIRPDGFQITEFTRATDRYDAAMDLYAGYGMVDIALGQKWRLVGGLRIESADINVRTLDPLIPGAQAQQAQLSNTDPVPGINLIYQLSGRQNLRISYAHTVSRPDFRELSPFDFNNVLGGFVAQGNPNLLRATVHNYDARWEYFPGGNQLIAVSFFSKQFKNPIESTVLPANDLRQTYVNAQGALNSGIELEMRRELTSLSKRLKGFALQSNFTLVKSDISIRPEDATLLTSKDRPLLGQSRFIVNAIVEYNNPKWHSNARFYANHVARRISDVGTFGLPDIYQEGNTFLDFVYQYTFGETGRWNLRFNAENLGDNTYRWTQGPFTQRQFQLGRTFSIGAGFNIF